MATISTLNRDGSTTHKSRGGSRTPYMAELYIDLADAVTAKGTALAQADIIEGIYVPAGTRVLFAGIQKITAMTGTSTDLTFDVGITGSSNADAYVDGVDYDGLAVGAFATPDAAATELRFLTTSDTIDILFATQTGTVTGGIVRMFAWLEDSSNHNSFPGLVALGS